MTVHHHDLAAEFPEYKEKLHSLKGSDAHFKNLCVQYEELDKKIVSIENRIEPQSELSEEALKKERLIIKEQIYSYLIKGEATS